MTLNVGDPAPSFALDGDTGPIDPARLSGKAVVLYFYPKDDTSGCTTEAKAFTELHKEFLDAGAEVIGVSRDDAKSHGKFRAKYGLTHPLGSDVEGAVTEAYGVWVKKSMYGREYMGIERATYLIERATYLIDRAGKIAKVWRKVKVPGHAAEVISAVKGLA